MAHRGVVLTLVHVMLSGSSGTVVITTGMASC